MGKANVQFEFEFESCLFGPFISTIVKMKKRPTIPTVPYSTQAHALKL